MTDDPRFHIEEVWSASDLLLWRWRIDPPVLHLDLDAPAEDSLSTDRSSYRVSASVMREPPQASAPPPPWLIGFSKQFKKDTHELDRKLMGRILEVLEDLSDHTPPFHPRGDTFKPLKGELEGCWRYRIGDGRLVLKPEVALAQLNAIAFGSRGSVYD